jgi:hypothetical protein
LSDWLKKTRRQVFFNPERLSFRLFSVFRDHKSLDVPRAVAKTSSLAGVALCHAPVILAKSNAASRRHGYLDAYGRVMDVAKLNFDHRRPMALTEECSYLLVKMNSAHSASSNPGDYTCTTSDGVPNSISKRIFPFIGTHRR